MDVNGKLLMSVAVGAAVGMLWVRAARGKEGVVFGKEFFGKTNRGSQGGL